MGVAYIRTAIIANVAGSDRDKINKINKAHALLSLKEVPL